jgi:hypothetical protein
MLGYYRVAAQLVPSRVVLRSTNLNLTVCCIYLDQIRRIVTGWKIQTLQSVYKDKPKGHRQGSRLKYVCDVRAGQDPKP